MMDAASLQEVPMTSERLGVHEPITLERGTEAAFEAIAQTLPPRSVGYETRPMSAASA
jgi:hypothetical protein